MTADLTRRPAGRGSARRRQDDVADRTRSDVASLEDEIRDAVSKVIALLASRHARVGRPRDAEAQHLDRRGT